ncbi:MAG: DUF1893 domain-containing protein [Ruminococcaceae bacterium]|nr:DUF1893 domain-containing protein [Oscillospiraceae bacterium]
MIQNKSKKLVIAGLMIALGIILPFATAHGFGITGNVVLPMHIPVLLCGFFCGPLYGALCGLILPVLNSILTGMPVLYPMAPLMTCELFTYGLISGLLYRLYGCSKKMIAIEGALIPAMLAGRIVYGIAAWILLFFDADAGQFSVVSSVVTGLPGILIQIVLIPVIVSAVQKRKNGSYDAINEAIKMLNEETATCVLVKDNKIISAESPRGIAYIIDLYHAGELKDVYVADKIIGKAAAMIFSLGGINGCYGETVSQAAVEWMKLKNIPLQSLHIVSQIENRKGDGMCPMEETVTSVFDEREALTALENKIAELRSANQA